MYRRATELNPEYCTTLLAVKKITEDIHSKLNQRAKQKQYRSKQTVGKISELYLEMAVDICEVVLKVTIPNEVIDTDTSQFNPDPNLIYICASWTCDKETAQSGDDIIPTDKVLFAQSTEKFKEALSLDPRCEKNNCRWADYCLVYVISL